MYIDSKLKMEIENAGETWISKSKSGLSLYPHQQKAIEKMDKKILNDDNYSGLLVLPTGGGKTLTATYWVMKSLLDKNKKIIWIAHRHELLNQAKKSFETVSYKDILKNTSSYNWRIISGYHDKPVNIQITDDIIIGSKTSLSRGINFLKEWVNHNKDNIFVVIDEAHHATAKEYRKLIDDIRKSSKNLQILGLTATPFRTADNEQGLLKKVFTDDIVYKIDLRELINMGILSKPVFENISTDVDMIDLFENNNANDSLDRISSSGFFDIETIGKDISEKIAKHAVRNNFIVNHYLNNKDKYGKTIVFALNIDMAIALNALFNEKGIASDFVVSGIRNKETNINISSKENIKKIKKFKDGKIDVLINVNILTEGTDIPNVQSIFLTRPTKSKILMTQMIGRGLRGPEANGTEYAYIVSFVDKWENKISWITPEELFIDENVNFDDNTSETQYQVLRLISINKMEEFTKIIDGTIDERLSDIDFIERIPIGVFKFSYLIKNSNTDDDFEKNSNILVYDSMRLSYDEFFEWIKNKPLKEELENIEDTANHIHNTLFGVKESLLGHEKQDIIDILHYYKQNNELPKMIFLKEREKFDIKKVAKNIVKSRFNRIEEDEFISNLWKEDNNKWSVFFGTENERTFRKLIDEEVYKVIHPENIQPFKNLPITKNEERKIEKLSLYEIDQKFPEIGKNIRNTIFKKFTDEEGYYYSAISGFKSKDKLDFQIDHKRPMSKGGLTKIENLQLLTRFENMQKGDKY